MTYKTVLERYRPVVGSGDLDESDLHRVGSFLEETDAAGMQEWAESRTETYDLNGQRYRMVVDRPDDEDPNKVVVVTGEVGNGISPWALARAKSIRSTVAPEARLVYQPNPTLGQDHMNYSKQERHALRAGDLAPLLGRIARVLVDDLGDPNEVTFYGPSQGGVVALEYAADRNTPAMAVAVVEPPNILERSYGRMGLDFLGCGGQLKDVIRENYADPSALFAQETIAALSPSGMAKFVLGLGLRDNLAMVGSLRRDSARDLMTETLAKGGSVVHAYGTVNKVSPLEANEQIAAILGGHERYRAMRFEGSDHSMTNQYAVNGALARAANRLLQSS